MEKRDFIYLYYGESFSIKDELKAAGFRFNPILKWYTYDPQGYEDKVLCFKFEELCSVAANGFITINSNAQYLIEKRVAEATNVTRYTWVAAVGEKIRDVTVTLVKKVGFEGRYGYTNVFTFEDTDNHIYTWFTATEQECEIGDKLYLSGTIKAQDVYKGAKTNTLTRCRVRRVD